jgi:hypothetical protein
MKRTLLGILALSTAVSLAACGSSTTSDTNPSPSTSETSTSPSTSTAPSDGKVITAEKSGVTLVVPKSWVTVDAATLSDSSEVTKAAGLMNLSPEQFKQMAAQLDVMALAPDGAFHSNVNVVHTPLSGLPSEALLRAQFSQLGGEISKVETRSTPLGEATVATYELSKIGVHGVGLFVKTDNGVINVTFTARTADDAQKLYDQIVPTLATK